MSDSDSQGYSSDDDNDYSDDFASAGSPSPSQAHRNGTGEDPTENRRSLTPPQKEEEESSLSRTRSQSSSRSGKRSNASSSATRESSRSSSRRASSTTILQKPSPGGNNENHDDKRHHQSTSRASSTSSVPISSRRSSSHQSSISSNAYSEDSYDDEPAVGRPPVRPEETADSSRSPQRKIKSISRKEKGALAPMPKRSRRPIDEERLASLARPKPKPNKPTSEEEKRLATLEVQRRVMAQQRGSGNPRPPKGKQTGGRAKRRLASDGTKKKGQASSSGFTVPMPGSVGSKILRLNIDSGSATEVGKYEDAEKLLTQAYNLLQSETSPVPQPTEEEVDADFAAEKEKENKKRRAEGKTILMDDDEEEDKYDREDRMKRLHTAALAAFQKEKDPLLAMTLNNLGCLMRRVHKPAKALLYLEACVRLEKSIGKPSAITLLNACVAATETREFTQAQDLGKEALKLLSAAPSPPGREARVKIANIKTSVRYRIADAMFQEFKANVNTNVYEDDEEVMFNDADGVSEAFQSALHSSAQEGGGDGSQTAFIRQESKKVREFLQDFRLKYGGDILWTETKEGAPQTFRLPGGLAVPARAAAAYCRSQEQMVTTGLKQSLKPRCKEELGGRPTHEFSYTGQTLAASRLKELEGGGGVVRLPAIRYVNNVRSVYKTGDKVLPISYQAPKKRLSSPMRRTKPATARSDPLDANVVAVRATQSHTARRQSVAPGIIHRSSDATSVSAREEERKASLDAVPTVTITEASIRGIGMEKHNDSKETPTTKTRRVDDSDNDDATFDEPAKDESSDVSPNASSSRSSSRASSNEF